MRTFLPAALPCLAILMGGWLIAAAAAPGGGPPKTPAPASAPLPAAAQKPATAPIDNDAPARHLKRTACLKDAKTKKLVGSQRTAYVKGCMGTS
jgi:hypothetical protein